MANDPGRQLLEDQIQSTGFLFLDDYLDNIMVGPKHECVGYFFYTSPTVLNCVLSPFIELVKTPGRRKIAASKAKNATSKDKQRGLDPLEARSTTVFPHIT